METAGLYRSYIGDIGHMYIYVWGLYRENGKEMEATILFRV